MAAQTKRLTSPFATQLNTFKTLRNIVIPKHTALVVVDSNKFDLLTKEEAALVSKEIVNVREDIQDCLGY